MKSNSSKLEGMGKQRTASPEVVNFLRQIGSKGGKKRAQHPESKRLNKEAAIARWRGIIPKIKPPEK